MQRLFIIILSSFFLLISCSKSNVKPYLSEKDMTALMTQIHLIDGYLMTLNVDSSRKIIDALYAQEFVKYNLDSASFHTNLQHYLSNPIVAKKMYDQINTNLTTLNTQYTRADSLRNALHSDSVRVVNRLLSLAQRSKDLILQFHPDTTALTFTSYGMESINQHSLFFMQSSVPIAMPQLPRMDPPATAVDTLKGTPTVQDGVLEPLETIRSMDSASATAPLLKQIRPATSLN